MVDFVCVSPRSLKVKFKFEKIKICVVATYDPSEGNVEKSTIFWDNLNDVLDGGNRRFSSFVTYLPIQGFFFTVVTTCLLYTSDAADERSSVDLGGRRIIKKKKTYKAFYKL